MKPLLFLLPVTLFTATALMAQPVMDQVDAPQDGDQLWYMPASHVAISVFVGTITSSFGPMSYARRIK